MARELKVEMKHRPLGGTGMEPSILGLGCMRLPVIDGDNSRIDEPAAVELIRAAVDSGITYIDTAYPYHGPGWPNGGDSEVVLGRALAEDGYRDRVLIATKLTPETVSTPEECEAMLDMQLERLQTDHIDCYLLHSLNAGSWKKLVGLGALDLLDRAKADGRIRAAGFSFHDDLDVFKEIVDAYDWDFCQIQLNIVDVEFQAGLAGLRYAAEKGLGVVIMEPLKGGRLARTPPAEVCAIWDDAAVCRSPVEWALRWIWSLPEVTTVLSGMTTLEQLEENVAVASAIDVGFFSPDDYARVDAVREAYQSKLIADCTACKYCMPCPYGLDIPTYLKMLNNQSVYNDYDNVKKYYDAHDAVRASGCTACGTCEALCPQHLPIIDLMEQVAEVFERS